MIEPALTLLTSLWHYTLARAVYEDLVRPVLRGHVSIVIVLALLVWGAFAVGRQRGRRA